MLSSVVMFVCPALGLNCAFWANLVGRPNFLFCYHSVKKRWFKVINIQKRQIVLFLNYKRNLKQFIRLVANTVKLVCSVQLQSLKKVSAIIRCPLSRGFVVIFTASESRRFHVLWTILWKLVTVKILTY